MQSLSAAQLALQAVGPQTYGVQAVVVATGQDPLEQDAALVCTPPEQLGGEHCVVG